MNKRKYLKISIVLPTFNRGYILWKAIQSVINQSYNNWELIVVDDSSTDDTSKMMKEFSTDSRIKFIPNRYKKGVSGARESGCETATGDYIGYLDSDNTVSNNWLEVIVDRVTNKPEIKFIVPDRNFQMLYFKDDRFQVIVENSQYEISPSIEALWRHDFEGDPNGLVHIKEKDMPKWDENLTIYEDYDFTLQLAIKYPSGMSYIPQALVNYSRKYGGDGICSTTSYDDLIKNLNYLKEKYSTNPNWKKLSKIPEKIDRYTKLKEQGYTPLKRILEKYKVL